MLRLCIHYFQNNFVKFQYNEEIQFPNGKIYFIIPFKNFDSGIYIVKVASKQFEFNKNKSNNEFINIYNIDFNYFIAYGI